MIRFLIPLTLIASQKLCAYSMCLDLEMQGKGKRLNVFFILVRKSNSEENSAQATSYGEMLTVF